MNKITETLRKADKLLHPLQNPHFWQRSQDKRDAKARSILNKLRQSPDLSARVSPFVDKTLADDFSSNRSLAQADLACAITIAEVEQSLQPLRNRH